MFLSSPRASPKMAALPRRLSSIMVSVVGMAMFLVFASLLLVSYPISSTVRGYFYGVDREIFVVSPVNQSTVETTPANNSDQGVPGANILDRILGVDSPNNTESNSKNNEAGDQSGSPVEKKEDNSNSASVDATKNASAESESSSKNNETVEKPGRSIEKEENNGNSASDNATKNTSDESESRPKNNETVEKPGGSIQNEENNGSSASDNATKNTSDESESSPKNNETVEKPGGSIQNEEKNGSSVSDNMAKNTSVESESSMKNNETKDQSAGSTENKENSGNSASNNATNNTSVESESSTKNNETKEQSAGSVENKENSGNSAPDNATKNTSVESGECNLYHGTWFYDPLGPLYTNNSCPVLTQMQNCQGNGRPDKDYENWRWRPSGCELPRFDARKFLELMRGKTLAFVGDSVARNQMESLLCLLWQVEAPKNRGNKKMQRWYFRSTNVMIVRIWSSWLVHQTSEKLDFAPEGVAKLHLDVPDETFMEFIPKFDVIVISSGHWFAKQSVYVLNNEIVGGQLWWPDKSRPMKVNNVQAFGISVETSLAAIATHPNFTGLAIVRSWSPDHYEGGAWNTGGSCTGKEKPLAPGELVENGFTDVMHKQQVEGFERASQKVPDNSKIRLMDITEVFSYRHDGHPGPYRSPDPNKIVKRGPDGRPPPQDCLHWCMPGPVDTWNELVLEIIRREFEGKQRLPS